jgi:hypothetical protein
MALNKMHGLGLLFTMLVVILIVSPRSINNMYNNILGRVGLIALIIFFAMHNVTLGLLVALCIIVASNMYMFEGFDNASIGTGENIDPSLIGSGQNIVNLKQELQQAQASTSTTDTSTTAAPATTSTATTTTATTPTTITTSTGGVDRQSVQQAIQSKSSNTIPVNKGMFKSKYDEVAPSTSTSTTTQEAFSSMWAPY